MISLHIFNTNYKIKMALKYNNKIIIYLIIIDHNLMVIANILI